MTFEEILEHLRAKKKVRRTAWDAGVYIILNSDNRLNEFNGETLAFVENVIHINNILASDWEVIE